MLNASSIDYSVAANKCWVKVESVAVPHTTCNMSYSEAVTGEYKFISMWSSFQIQQIN